MENFKTGFWNTIDSQFFGYCCACFLIIGCGALIFWGVTHVIVRYSANMEKRAAE